MRAALTLLVVSTAIGCGDERPPLEPPDDPGWTLCADGERATNGCGTCVCADGAWSCPADGCGTVTFKAGFQEIEPVTFTLRRDLDAATYVSSTARLWYAFQPAAAAPEDKPLVVMFNGGPGASTSSLLFSFNTARQTLDPAVNGAKTIGDNPFAWTSFANLLYIDARNTGFSYALTANPEDEAARHAEFSVQNHNTFLDAADFVRVVLRFLSRHPALADNPVIIVGESYGGARTTVMLHLLLNYSDYAAGTRPYQDIALAAEIQAHFERLHPEYIGLPVPADVIAAQFGYQALLQPLLSGGYESVAKGAMWEEPGSVIFQIGQAVGIDYLPCSVLGGDCHPVANALDFVSNQAGRDPYWWSQPLNWTTETSDAISANLMLADTLSQAVGIEVSTVASLVASGRAGAYRIGDPAQLNAVIGEGGIGDQGDFVAALGELPAWDAYHVFFNNYVFAAFRADDIYRFDIHHGSIRNGTMFLENAARVQTFLTDAAFDLRVYSPAQPAALAMYSELLTGTVHDAAPRGGVARPGWLYLDYQPGLFAGVTRRTIRFPHYASSGHVIELSEPMALRDDLSAWWTEIGP